jgi:hypothetical protein
MAKLAVCPRIDYDRGTVLLNNQIYCFLQLMRTEPSYSQIRAHDGSMERLDEIHAIFHAR